MSDEERFEALSLSIALGGVSAAARRATEGCRALDSVFEELEAVFEELAVRALDRGLLTPEERTFLEGTVERCRARSFGRTLAAIDALPEGPRTS